jgi:hypothetical protein
MNTGILGRNGDSALSEVVGFVLIIALIMAAFSLYLTYGVPAQGRESEILHMNEVKDQFIDYKTGLDSLANNNKVGATVSNAFTLGTEGGYTEGMMSFIPIMSPQRSGGTISINRRTTSPETLTITSQSLIRDPANATARTSVDLPTIANYTPDHVYVNISIPSGTALNSTGTLGLTANATNGNTTRWTALINLTPQVSFYQYYKPHQVHDTGVSEPCLPEHTPGADRNGTPLEIFDSEGFPSCLVPMNAHNYTGTDVTISIAKATIPSMEKYTIYKNVTPGNTYTVDLMDSAYGLSSATDVGDQINLVEDLPLSPVIGNGNVTYAFIEQTYTIEPMQLGSVAYSAKNNYWISQDYYYQMGGVFLSQVDGNDTYKLPPGIAFSVDDSELTRRIIQVNIDAIRITDPYGGSIVGGNTPVQIKTTLDSLYTFPYATGTANTKSIRIGFNTSDDQARIMWKNYFDYTSRVADLPSDTETGISDTEAYILIKGFDTSETKGYDINVVATNATYMARLYGVGG